MSVGLENPVVVDSPIPQDQPLASSVGQSAQPVGNPAGAGDAPAADPLQELADSVGLDRQQLDSFKDADTARNEIQRYLEDRYKRGLELNTPAHTSGGGSPPPNQPPRDDHGRFVPAGQAPAAPVDFAAVGLNADDPAAKVIAQLAGQLQSSTDRLAAIERQFQESRANADEAQKAQIEAELGRVFDAWNSTDFGSARSQTVFQEASRAAVKRIAGGLLRSEIQDYGRRISDLPTLLKQARYVFETSKSPRQAPLPQSPGGATIPDSRSGLTQPAGANTQPGAYTKRLADDPRFLQRLRQLG